MVTIPTLFCIWNSSLTDCSRSSLPTEEPDSATTLYASCWPSATLVVVIVNVTVSPSATVVLSCDILKVGRTSSI